MRWSWTESSRLHALSKENLFVQYLSGWHRPPLPTGICPLKSICQRSFVGSKRLYALCLRLSAGSISRCRLRMAVIVLLVGPIVSSILEHPGQYVSSLGRVLPTKVYDELLHLGTRSVRGVMGALREIIQTLPPASRYRLLYGADTVRSYSHPRSAPPDELFPLRHGCNLPRHRNPPETGLMV